MLCPWVLVTRVISDQIRHSITTWSELEDDVTLDAITELPVWLPNDRRKMLPVCSLEDKIRVSADLRQGLASA